MGCEMCVLYFLVLMFLATQTKHAMAEIDVDCARLVDSTIFDKCCPKPNSYTNFFRYIPTNKDQIAVSSTTKSGIVTSSDTSATSTLSSLLLSSKTVCKDLPETINERSNPCFYDCAFNAYNLFDGNHLNMRNLYETLNTINKSEISYIKTLRNGYFKCQSIVEKFLPKIELNINPTPKPKANCSKLAYFYYKCAEVHVFVSCPRMFWRGTVECEDAQQQLLTCMSLLGEDLRKKPQKRSNGSPNSFKSTYCLWHLAIFLGVLFY